MPRSPRRKRMSLIPSLLASPARRRKRKSKRGLLWECAQRCFGLHRRCMAIEIPGSCLSSLASRARKASPPISVMVKIAGRPCIGEMLRAIQAGAGKGCRGGAVSRCGRRGNSAPFHRRGDWPSTEDSGRLHIGQGSGKTVQFSCRLRCNRQSLLQPTHS